MKIISLNEYLESHGTQAVLAAALGVNQSAISQMVKAGRNIQITITADGCIEANEVRPIPARPKTSSAAHSQ
ncbi:repressor [Pseudomonas koreensis]|nr:repressor [Pseudomonas koreensis]